MKDWLIIIATIVAPLVAVQVSQYIEKFRQKREERLRVFKTLMATRAANLDPRHIEALNQIDVVFHSNSKDDVSIRNSWKQYLDHLADKNYPKEAWEVRRMELLVELLYSMAVALGYSFDKTHIKNQAYFPVGYGDINAEQTIIRKALVDILSANKPLPVCILNQAAVDREKLADKH